MGQGPGASVGRRVIHGMISRADVHELEVCLAILIDHKNLFLVITLIMSKVPNLNSLREREKFLLSLQGLDCL